MLLVSDFPHMRCVIHNEAALLDVLDTTGHEKERTGDVHLSYQPCLLIGLPQCSTGTVHAHQRDILLVHAITSRNSFKEISTLRRLDPSKGQEPLPFPSRFSCDEV